MSDVTVIQEEPEAAPVESHDVASATNDDLDSLLAEYDSKVRPSELPTSENTVQQDAPASPDELDKLLSELSGPDPKVAELQGQLNGLHQQLRAQENLAEFNEFASDLQSRVTEMSPHASDDWVRLRLESAAHNPEICLAWDTRHINPADASRDLAYVQHALNQLQGNPSADPKQLQELNKLAYQLDVATRSHSILRGVKNSILREAASLKPPYDPDASADYFAVAQAVREANHGDIPSPPVRLGELTDAEFKEYTRKNFGF